MSERAFLGRKKGVDRVAQVASVGQVGRGQTPALRPLTYWNYKVCCRRGVPPLPQGFGFAQATQATQATRATQVTRATRVTPPAGGFSAVDPRPKRAPGWAMAPLEKEMKNGRLSREARIGSVDLTSRGLRLPGRICEAGGSGRRTGIPQGRFFVRGEEGGGKGTLEKE